MYQIADKYIMADLKEEARLKFQIHVDQLEGYPRLFSAFHEVVPTIYEKSLKSDIGIRAIVEELGCDYMDDFRALREFDANTVGDWLADVNVRLKEKLAEVNAQLVTMHFCHRCGSKQDGWTRCDCGSANGCSDRISDQW